MKSRLKQYISIVFNVYYGILALSGAFSRPTVLESLTIIQKTHNQRWFSEAAKVTAV